MSRSSRIGELVFYPKVKRTARANRKAKRREENLPTLMLSTSNSESEREAEIFENMAEHRTLRELATSNANHQPLCIEFLNIDVDFELKFGLIHLLPTFQGIADEDPRSTRRNSMWFVQP
jgi:hypothetical protein